MGGTSTTVLGCLLLWAPTALAQAAPTPDSAPEARRDARRTSMLSADPNRRTLSLGYRGAVRGTMGIELPLWSSPRGNAADEGGVGVDLTPMLELHEPPGSDQPIPNQFWRGLLALQVHHGHPVGDAWLRLGVALEHESDHETAHPYSSPGFLTLNDVALSGRWSAPLGPVRMAVGAAGQLYLISCTKLDTPCENYRGSTAGGGALDLIVDAAGVDLLGLHPFASAFASAIMGHGVIADERRMLLQVGLWHPLPTGLLQLSALGFFGNDVGRNRDQSLQQVGVHIAWTLDLRRSS